MKFLDNVEYPLYFPAPLPDCLYRISFRRYSPLSLEVVKNQTNVKDSWPPIFFRGMTQTVLWHIVNMTVIYRPPFGKVWLCSISWCPSAKPGNEVESRVGKNDGPF